MQGRNEMKRFVAIMLMLLLAFSSVSMAEELTNELPIKVELNGKLLTFDVEPTIISDRTVLPVRVIFEALGLKVGWDGDTRTVTGTDEVTVITLQIDNTTATVNGEEVILDVPATIIDNRTVVPARFVAESTGAEVGWNGETRTVLITCESEEIKALRSKIDYVCDEKLFLIYAFINHTGFDYENGSTFSEIRSEMREKLASMNLDLIDDKFYLNHKDKTRDDRYYWDWYENTTALPEMKLVNADAVPEVLHSLGDNLIEFYQEANIHELYLSYLDDYEKEFDLYRDSEVLGELAETIEFMKLDINEIDDFAIAINPMGVSQTGHASPINSKYYVTVGPYFGEANEHNLIHEYIHTHVNPALDSLPDEIERSQRLGELRNYKNEAFVIALQVMHLDSEAEQLGFIDYQAKKKNYDELEDIYNRFKDEFPSYDGNIESFIHLVVMDYYNKGNQN